MKKLLSYFSKGELLLWFSSLSVIILSFALFDRENYLTLIASLLGVTSLIFGAKGNPLSPFLMIIFSILYGFISLSFRYYGEMATYLGMTLPMSAFALVTWLKNPYKGNKSQVTVGRIKIKEIIFLCILTAFVTVIFYFILGYFNTANLLPSTISVATSFAAAYLTARRSPYFALLYAMNDTVLIILWILAAKEDISYLSVIICFVMFLVNDLYGFISWKRMEKTQKKG